MLESEITTFFLSMTPFGELRLSLPLALTVYHLNPALAYLISVLGNLVPVVFLLLFLGPACEWLSRNSKIFEKFFSWLFQKTKNRYRGKIRKYGLPALTAFVAIPLPITGGWTGALIAFLFDIPFKKALPLIALGLMIAGGIVLAVTQTGLALEKYFGWQVLAGVFTIVAFGWLIYRVKIQNPKSKIQN